LLYAVTVRSDPIFLLVGSFKKALELMIQGYEGFPYTICEVSDIHEANGSSSMTSVCGGTL